MARPTLLTDEVHKRIVDLVRAGNYVETAAAAAGVGTRTVRDWMRRGANEDDGIYRALADDIAKAHAEAEALAIQIVNRAATGGDWRAIAWKLERTRPRFAQKVNVTHEVREELASDLLRRLRERLDAETFQRVHEALLDDCNDEDSADGLEH